MKETKNSEGTVFLGKKKFGVYVKAIMTTIEKSGSVFVKTRGQNIPAAIIICDFLMRDKNLIIDEIAIGTEVFKVEDKERRIPEISIKLLKAVSEK